MRMQAITFTAIAAGLGALPGAALAEHFDVLLLRDDVNGVVKTGAFDDDTATVVSSHRRVFGADFGETDPGQPNFSDEPGLRALAGDFDNSFWGFNIVDAVRAWNGVDFSTIADHTITMNFGPSPDVVSPLSAGGFSSGFTINVGTGGFDDHLNIFYDGPEDASSDGIYLLALEAFSEDLGASDPFYFVMNRGLSEEGHDAAIDYVRSMVPAPSALALFGLAGCGASRRRRA